MSITIIALGKLKEAHWKDAEAEYLKRLKPYAKIEILELPEESFRESDDREKIKAEEAEKIAKHIPVGAQVIALHERGKEMTSPELADFLEKKSAHGEQIVFVIGGPLGLHESILKNTPIQLSLSRLTFPHQMVRTILFEQLYRSITIQMGKQYHY